jgi:hypothetical protein
MALTNAERQARYRARKRIEREKAPAGVTPPVTKPKTRDDVTPKVPKLAARGRRLWADFTGEGQPELNPTERVLLEEACRIADRLDRLDRILNGDEDAWMRLHTANEDGSIVKVVLNNALAEARQQATALKQLVSELRQSRPAAGAGRPPGVPLKPKGVAGVGTGSPGTVDRSLAARIAAKRRPPAAG